VARHSAVWVGVELDTVSAPEYEFDQRIAW